MRNMGTRNVTAAELPFIPAKWRNELVRGEVRPMTPPGFKHGLLATRLTTIIDPYVRSHGLGIYLGFEVGFLIEREPDTVRGPDGAFLRAVRLEGIDPSANYVEGPPDLAIEIISPSDRPTAVREKARMWVSAGAAMVVVLDPRRRTAAIHTSDGEHAIPEGGRLEFGGMIPDLTIPLADLFATA